MTYTQNYQLPQWVKSDRILMDDFNDANAKIDAALKSHDDSLASHAAQMENFGNCRIVPTTYQGTGRYGADHPTTLSFTQGEPLLVLIMDYYGHFILIYRGASSAINGSTWVSVSWTPSGVSWYSTSNADEQMNSGGTYHVFLIYAS